MKNTCTFFGHRDAPESIRYDLKQTLIDLIENSCFIPTLTSKAHRKGTPWTAVTDGWLRNRIMW